jgi:imidazolonepropionase-like amidohydrolase
MERLRSLTAFSLIAGIALPPVHVAQAASPQAEIALRAGRVLDPAAGRYRPQAIVLIRDGKIGDVLPAERYQPEMADREVDLREFTLLPGLIDGHVHLTIGGDIAANARADLRAGFTTVVDMGARTLEVLRRRDSLRHGRQPAPRVLAAGIWAGVKGGVCEFNGIGIAGGADEFRARIRANAQAGAEIAKLCVTGWPAEAFAHPGRYELPDEILRASVAAAHDVGQIAVVHDISLGGVRAALAAGIDGLVHAAYLDSTTAAQMRQAGVFLIPTLASLTANDTSAASRALIDAVRLAHQAGVTIVFGTDGGVLPHGRNAEEFRALVDAGLSPLDAIRAATVNAAKALRIQDTVGAIRAGMAADIIAVRGDPLTDIAALATPVFVMSRGRIVREELARPRAPTR